MNFFILLLMIFFHIVDDFYFQSRSFLVNGKQKSWWKENAPDEMYKYDYLVALFFHSFSWTFMMMLPLFMRTIILGGTLYPIPFVINLVTHFIVDDLKANRKKLNLIQDQEIHMFQIFLTWLSWLYVY